MPDERPETPDPIEPDGETIVREPHATRDHTEVMAPVYGADLSVERQGAGLIARVRGGRTLSPANVSIPGDPSSAAFPAAAALVTRDSEITVTGVMTNSARFGLYEVLKMMGNHTIAHRVKARWLEFPKMLFIEQI